MARRKKRHVKRTHVKKVSHKRRRRAKARSGFFGRSMSAGYSLNTLPRILLSAAILRFGSGLVYYWFRSQFQKAGADPKKLQDNFNKAKIIFPTLIAIASVKKWIPDLPGLTPMSIAMAFYSIVENFDSLRDLFDLKMLDAQPGKSAAPVAGPNARSWADTRRQLASMHLPVAQSGFPELVATPYSRNGYEFKMDGYQFSRSGYDRSGIGGFQYDR